MRRRNGRLAKYLRTVPGLVPADIGTTDTLSRRYRDDHYTNPSRRDLFRDPVVTAQRSREAVTSAWAELMARQHGADGFDQLRLWHGALRFGLLLQMLLAAFFQLG